MRLGGEVAPAQVAVGIRDRGFGGLTRAVELAVAGAVAAVSDESTSQGRVWGTHLFCGSIRAGVAAPPGS